MVFFEGGEYLTMKETFDVDVDLTLPVRRPPCLLARGHHGLPLVLVQGLRQQLLDLPELLRGVILLESGVDLVLRAR